MLSERTERLAYPVPIFCAEIGISKSQLYVLVAKGEGPRITKLGRRSVILADDGKDWLRQMRAKTDAAVVAV